MKFVFWQAAALSLTFALQGREPDRDMLRFAATKEGQVREYSESLPSKVPSIVWSFFDAVRVDDWRTATNLAARIDAASGRYSLTNLEPLSPALQTLIWPPISETIGAYDEFHSWDNKWLHRFGSGIIDSIPRGSIYFGGTDPGRFVISALMESQREARPFFVLTQNQLVDQAYVDYLRKMYGSRIYIPTLEDLRNAFAEYTTDARQRLKEGKLKPGENVRVTDDGRVQVGGQIAVMEINGRLAKLILQKNPDREFYVEESFPLDWMYPQLSPHGLILKLNSQPLASLPDHVLRKDDEYWKQLMKELIGEGINEASSIREICAFNEKIYLRKDLAGFKGDSGFVNNAQAQKCFAKLRTSIAAMYAWRASEAKDLEERSRMRKAADLAFRQAVVLCPYSPETVFQYSKLLTELKRTSDAIQITKTCLLLDPDSSQVESLLRSLHQSE